MTQYILFTIMQDSMVLLLFRPASGAAQSVAVYISDFFEEFGTTCVFFSSAARSDWSLGFSCREPTVP